MTARLTTTRITPMRSRASPILWTLNPELCTLMASLRMAPMTTSTIPNDIRPMPEFLFMGDECRTTRSNAPCGAPRKSARQPGDRRSLVRALDGLGLRTPPPGTRYAPSAPVDQRRIADLLVRCLEHEGVTCVFGIPGEENIHFTDALARSSIRYVLVRHEQAASFMAEIFGRLTGRAGRVLGDPRARAPSICCSGRPTPPPTARRWWRSRPRSG